MADRDRGRNQRERKGSQARYFLREGHRNLCRGIVMMVLRTWKGEATSLAGPPRVRMVVRCAAESPFSTLLFIHSLTPSSLSQRSIWTDHHVSRFYSVTTAECPPRPTTPRHTPPRPTPPRPAAPFAGLATPYSALLSPSPDPCSLCMQDLIPFNSRSLQFGQHFSFSF